MPYYRGALGTQRICVLPVSHDRHGNKSFLGPVTQVSVASSQLCCFPCTDPICWGPDGFHGSRFSPYLLHIPSPPVTLLQKTSPEEPCHLSEIPINCHTLCLSAVMLWHRGRQTRCSLQEQRPHETRKEEAILGRLGIKMQHSPSSGNKFGRHHHMLASGYLLPPMDLMHSLGHALPSTQSQQAPEWLSQVCWGHRCHHI